MDRIDITFSALRRALEEYVFSLPPDAKYVRGHGAITVLPCLYVHGPETHAELTEEQPGCLMGIGLHAVGVGLRTLSEYEGTDIAEVLLRLESVCRVGLDWNAHRYALNVQSAQDSGLTWREALAAGDRAHLESIFSSVWSIEELNDE